MHPSSQDSGFTLFEMLLTLAIVGVTFSLASSAISIGNQMLDRTRHASERLDERSTTGNVLVDALAQVVPGEADGLVGTASKLEFASAAPRVLATGLPIDNTFETGPDHRGLRASWARPNQDGAVTHILIAELTEVQFSYFARGTGWLSEWKGRDLPDLVRIEFRDRFGSRSDLVMSVRALASTPCRRNMAQTCGTF